jgi:beta-phosphoglucomutase-like phosphatase (HAD superfamily)
MKGEGEPMVERKKDPKMLEELFVIDFDRTLVDSSRLGHLFLDALGECSKVDMSELHARLDTEKGKSFNLLDAAYDVIGLDETLKGQVEKKFIETAEALRSTPKNRGGFFEKGALELLELLDPEQRMIFTYGSDERWQRLKLKAAGLYDQHHQITTEMGVDGKPVPKPVLLAHMWQGDHFEVSSVHSGDTPLHAKKLVMIDDKYENLENLPDGVEGYLYITELMEQKLSEENLEKVREFFKRNPTVRPLRQLDLLMPLSTQDALF